MGTSLLEQVTAETLPITASDKEKEDWLERQHQLAKTWFSYKFKPRSQYEPPEYFDRVLAIIQHGQDYRIYFCWKRNIVVEEDLYYDVKRIETGPGVEIHILLGPWNDIFALDKETVLQWARQEGGI